MYPLKTDLPAKPQASVQLPDTPAKPPWGFLHLAVIFIALRVPWIFMVPMQEAPDEFAHYWVINFLHQHWRLPSASEVFAGGPSAVYGSLPQLGYIPHVLACALGTTEQVPLLSRFGSLAAGLFLLYAAWRCGKLLFPRHRWLSLALPACITVHPQMIFLHSYSNCDATASALSAVLTWLMIDTVQTRLSLRRSAMMGFLAGWLALTKYSALAILPVLVLAGSWSCLIHATPVAAAASCLFTAALLCVTLSGWWFIRNGAEFSGDYLGTATMYNTWARTFNRELDYHLSAWRIIKDIRWWRMMFFSFWGLFGYMNKYMWRPVYLTYVGFLLASTASIACWLLLRVKNAFRAVRKKQLNAGNIWQNSEAAVWVCLVLIAAINLAAMIWASTKNLGGPQGRYLFNSEIPVLAILLAGLAKLPRGNVWVWSFIAFNAAVAAGCLFWLLNLYGGFRSTPWP